MRCVQASISSGKHKRHGAALSEADAIARAVLAPNDADERLNRVQAPLERSAMVELRVWV